MVRLGSACRVVAKAEVEWRGGGKDRKQRQGGVRVGS